MRRTALLTTLLLCCMASYAFAIDDPFATTHTPQSKGYGDPPQPATLVGGDTFATATVIPALPYADGGNTCAFANDYAPTCALTAAPDVVYRFSPTVNACINVSTCGSAYDTMIQIYQNNVATPIACNDDFCGLQSTLSGVALAAGNTYYIVIDGYNTACGDYTMNVTACPPPPVCDPCPPLAVLEGEPVCANGYIDNYNGGCNSVPPVTTNLLCEPTVTVCGTYGTFINAGISNRDTDWYQVTVNAATVISASVKGQGLTGTALAILDTSCAPAVLCGQFTALGNCVQVNCNAAVGPGTYRIFVASFFDNTPCGSPYVLTLSGLACPPTELQTSSWGALKSLYR